PVRLIRAGSDPEGVQRKAGVSNPSVAIVPVALSPCGFGQGGSGCGDECSCGTEHECLQHTATVMDQVPPRSLVSLMQVRPGTPSHNGVMQGVGYRRLRRHLWSLLPARPML